MPDQALRIPSQVTRARRRLGPTAGLAVPTRGVARARVLSRTGAASARDARDPDMRTITAVVALVAALPCQQAHRTAHPQETLQNGNGDVSPLGCLAPTAFTEARAQILFRSEELPGPGALLVGIEVHCQDTLSLDYASLEMDAFATNATSLSVRFADNIKSPVTEMLRATHLPVDYDSTRWTNLPGSGTYLHDGVSGLVIEIRKVVDPATARF